MSSNNQQISRVTRRDLIIGGLACAASPIVFPNVVRAADPEFDVIIIGAGAAGLAAARTIKNANKSFIVLEASTRIGGRAYTDNKHFGVACDYGAHWLHYGERNPFRQYGLSSGGQFEIYLSPDEYAVFDPSGAWPNNRYSAADVEDFLKYYTEDLANALCIADDESPHNLLANGPLASSQWFGSAALLLGNWDMGKDWIEFSNKDYQHSPDTRLVANLDYLCKQGYGALVADSGGNIPVRLATKATKIERVNSAVTVTTTQETLTAKACILTVSAGVIANGDIEILGMPSQLRQAFADLPMANYNRVILQFTEDVFGTGSDHFAFTRVADVNGGRPASIVFTSNVFGTNLVYGDVGGKIGSDLSAAGPEAMRDYALDQIDSMLGADTRQKFTGTYFATQWHGNDLFRGAYASPLPGKAHQRKTIIGASVDDLIFFAGEAHHDCEWATVSGAHKSGCQVAQEVLHVLSQIGSNPSLCENVLGTADSATPSTSMGAQLCSC